MAITIGGKTPQSINIGGKEVQSLAINGEIVWSLQEPDYFYIRVNAPRAQTVTVTKTGSPSGNDLQYSKDKSVWTAATFDANGVCEIEVTGSEKVYLRSTTGLSSGTSSYYTFDASEDFTAGGNIATLINYNGAITTSLYRYYSFYRIFAESNISDASELDLSGLPYGYVYSFYYAFYNCVNLISAPELPFKIVYQGAFYGMFNGCTALEKAPDLPATTLATECYRLMFNGCTSLTEVPEVLPATTSATGCYRAMFQNCSSITKSPEIYCSPTSSSSFNYMFYGCTNLEEITVHSTTWETSNTTYFNYKVSSSGTFYNLGGATIPTGTTGVPTNWATLDRKYFYLYTADTIGDPSAYIRRHGEPGANLQYSTNGQTWTNVTFNSSNVFHIPLSHSVHKVYFRSSNHFSVSSSAYYRIYSSAKNILCGGDIRTLIDYTDTTLDTSLGYDFYGMFSDTPSYGLINATKLDLSKIKNVAAHTFDSMFKNNTVLGGTYTPTITEGNVGSMAYNQMFYGTNVSKIILKASTWDTSNSTDWLYNAASSGSFYNLGGATIPTGTSGIPSGWTVYTEL